MCKYCIRDCSTSYLSLNGSGALTQCTGESSVPLIATVLVLAKLQLDIRLLCRVCPCYLSDLMSTAAILET